MATGWCGRLICVHVNDRYIFGVYLQTFLAAARIMQTGTKHGGAVEVDNQHILFKLFCACNELPLLIKDHASTIEDQLILSTNHIEENNNHTVIGCAGCQHFLAEYALAGIVG